MGDGAQWVIWPGRFKVVHQVFASRAFRVRRFEDNVIRSLRVALGRHRLAFVLARRR